MNTQPFDAEELEAILIQSMIALVVRTPDGWTRIGRAMVSVGQAGTEMITPDEVADLRRQQMRLVD